MKLSLFIWALTLLFSVQVHAQWQTRLGLSPVDDQATFDTPAWQARHGLTSVAYQATFNSLTSQGYRLTWVSGYTINNDPRFAAIFEKKSSPAWVAHHGMTSADYQFKFNTYVSQGYRLVLVNGYTVSGVAYFVTIWDKSPSGQWVACHGLTSADYQAAFNQYTSD